MLCHHISSYIHPYHQSRNNHHLHPDNGENQAPEKQKKSDCDAEPGTPGVYSPARFFLRQKTCDAFSAEMKKSLYINVIVRWEEKPLMGNGRSKSGLSSDAGSDHTDQSLLVSFLRFSNVFEICHEIMNVPK